MQIIVCQKCDKTDSYIPGNKVSVHYSVCKTCKTTK
ncbi:GapA-binding peptide SR1P [Pseudalkalibacillus caeni]|uniref:GapA-binding peptide SR1P n=1 Tax=Exobacillus caeni TaxID=2574798 RepID=A0A5R9F827_9BACL|nr:GapA-binding peptide SR1P [Pseudalkalibacillus caeni]TLS38669.1 GapA-binding peptide SR1P [Pseudalkalibacillus caeni]